MGFENTETGERVSSREIYHRLTDPYWAVETYTAQNGWVTRVVFGSDDGTEEWVDIAATISGP